MKKRRGKTRKSEGEKDQRGALMLVSMFLVVTAFLWIWSRAGYTPSTPSPVQTGQAWTSPATHLTRPFATVSVLDQFYGQSSDFRGDV